MCHFRVCLVAHVGASAVQGFGRKVASLCGEVAGLVHRGLWKEELDEIQVIPHLSGFVPRRTALPEPGSTVDPGSPALYHAVVQNGACVILPH